MRHGGSFKFQISKGGRLATAAASDQLRIRYGDSPGRRLGIPLSGPLDSEGEAESVSLRSRFILGRAGC